MSSFATKVDEANLIGFLKRKPTFAS
jgi:hypothetical protein